MHAVHVGDTWVTVGVTVGDGIRVRAAMGGPEGFGAGCDGTDLSVVPAAASPAGRSLLSVTTQSRAVAVDVSPPRTSNALTVARGLHVNMVLFIRCDHGVAQLEATRRPYYLVDFRERPPGGPGVSVLVRICT